LPPLEDGGKLVFADGAGHLFPRALEALLGQVKASQLLFHLSEKEEARRRQIRRIGRGGGGWGSSWIPLAASQFLTLAAVWTGVLSILDQLGKEALQGQINFTNFFIGSLGMPF
jgi:hypothetical protein